MSSSDRGSEKRARISFFARRIADISAATRAPVDAEDPASTDTNRSSVDMQFSVHTMQTDLVTFRVFEVRDVALSYSLVHIEA